MQPMRGDIANPAVMKKYLLFFAMLGSVAAFLFGCADTGSSATTTTTHTESATTGGY